MRQTIGSRVTAGAFAGAAAGLAGAAAMAVASKVEQLATRRPDSFVPAHTLGRLLRLRDPDDDRWSRNMAMHYASGTIGGALRDVMSAANLRGPFASLMHTNLRSVHAGADPGAADPRCGATWATCGAAGLRRRRRRRRCRAGSAGSIRRRCTREAPRVRLE